VLIGDVRVAVETVCVQALIFRGLVTSALFISSGLFIKRPDGSYLFTGSRPGTGHWHGHGYCARSIWVLRDGRPVRVKLRKHRCLLPHAMEIQVEGLWRALAILFIGALVLDVPVACLLAEARGRWDDRDNQYMF
jgi:hypothetical protein